MRCGVLFAKHDNGAGWGQVLPSHRHRVFAMLVDFVKLLLLFTNLGGTNKMSEMFIINLTFSNLGVVTNSWSVDQIKVILVNYEVRRPTRTPHRYVNTDTCNYIKLCNFS